jgi:hypothetical protein
MSNSGYDIWATGLVHAVKSNASKIIVAAFDHALTIISDSATITNGHEENSNPEDDKPDAADNEQKNHDKLVSMLFDVFYLQRALGIPGTDSTELTQLSRRLGSAAKLDDAAKVRLSKGATDYWKRTYLLFALLSE